MVMTVLARIRDELFPIRCVSCGRFDGRSLCRRCRRDLEPLSRERRCPNCLNAWRGLLNCPRCVFWTGLDGAHAAVAMAGPARRLVGAMKFRGVRAVARHMAEELEALEPEQPWDLVFPVPLHPKRLRSRGFNQSEELLRHLGWPQGEGRLRRVRNTKSQIGLHGAERMRNVRGAFAYSGPELDGTSVALVDDVLTTGATAKDGFR